MTGIERAIAFATESHAGQRRKGSDTPYILHPLRVGLALDELGFPGEVVTAGVLHDVVEDTAATLAQIEDAFGVGIAELVAAVTEPDKRMPWQQRKDAMLARIESMPLGAAAVKAADTWDNARSIAADHARVGEELWGRFSAGRERQVWYYGEVATRVADRLGSCELVARLRDAAAALTRL